MKALVERIKNGDRAALEELYLQQRPAFVNWLKKKFAVSDEVALDVYQETILAVYRNILNNKVNHFSSSMRTYLFAIGRNIWLNRHRKESRELSFAVSIDDAQEEGLQVENITAEAYYEQPSELIEAFKKVIKEMREPCYSVLKLSFLFDLPAKEIATKLAYKDVNVLYTQKNRCLKKVKLTMNKYYTKEDF